MKQLEKSSIYHYKAISQEDFLIQFGSLLLAMEEQTELPLNNMLTEPKTNTLKKHINGRFQQIDKKQQ